MKQFLGTLILSSGLIMSPLFSLLSQPPTKGEELCLFAADVFTALHEVEQRGCLKGYEQSSDPLIHKLALQFTASFKEGASREELQAAVSELGRLIKCSVDADYDMPYDMRREELHIRTALMEETLARSLPQNPNYHKLMIESLAEEKWDIALYAYLKIAEGRCQH